MPWVEVRGERRASAFGRRSGRSGREQNSRTVDSRADRTSNTPHLLHNPLEPISAGRERDRKTWTCCAHHKFATLTMAESGHESPCCPAYFTNTFAPRENPKDFEHVKPYHDGRKYGHRTNQYRTDCIAESASLQIEQRGGDHQSYQP